MNNSDQPNQATIDHEEVDVIDLRALGRRLLTGIPQTLGLAAIALALGVCLFVISSRRLGVDSTTRVVFSFTNFDQGKYPDGSNFQADDLRSPELIEIALQRLGLDSTQGSQSELRAAISIEGIIPDSVVKIRDRLRNAGQTPPTFIPDEYRVTLTLPRNFSLPTKQRERLLLEIFNAYRERFERTYVDMPLTFGTAFESLANADYPDYELILNLESREISSFLDRMAEEARNFRSPRSNLSFGDLAKQYELFTQIHLNQTLGLIRQFGLSKDRKSAMLKMDYHLKTLENQLLSASEQEALVQELLRRAQERSQNPVLGIKSQTTQQRTETPLIDQGLIDSLLANDAYNFLIRRALDAGTKTRSIQSDIAILQERREGMQEFGAVDSDPDLFELLDNSLLEIQRSYDQIIESIRFTFEDFQKQQFSDAIRVSMQPSTSSYYTALLKAGIVGGFVGTIAGIGLSLLGITVTRKKEA